MADFVPLDGPAVKRLFLDKRILRVRGHNLPSDMAFQHLAAVLNQLGRRDLRHRNSISERVQRLAEAAALLHDFIAEAPKCKYHAHLHRDYPEGIFDMYLDEMRMFPFALNRDLQKVREGIGRMAAMVPPHTEHDVDSSKIWHDHLAELERFFRVAMRSTNPAITISRKGPLPRFIAAVVPLICGQHPRAGAIIQELRRQNLPDE